jgi:hypothetical protein
MGIELSSLQSRTGFDIFCEITPFKLFARSGHTLLPAVEISKSVLIGIINFSSIAA